jgi:putative ABC transport system permease protein
MLIKTSVKSLYVNKLRSFLAALGIVIGIGAVIALLALGAGAQKEVMSRVTSLGTNLIIIRPGLDRGPRGVMAGSRETLTLDDAEAVLKNAKGVFQVAPVVNGGVQLKYFNKNAYAIAIGTSVTYPQIRTFEVEKGRFFTENETNGMARVAVLGPVTAENLFGKGNAVDEVIKLKGINFRIVGVLKAKGSTGMFNQDDQVLIPYTTAMRQVFGVDHLSELDIQTEDNVKQDEIQAAMSKVLRTRHRLLPAADDDFSIRNQAEMLEMASSVTRVFTVLLGGIAAISLLVGGIGIMNIMLVTVTERTREIGIRKAIGAKNRDIMGQFLIEATILSGFGGIVGVSFGMGLGSLVGRLSDLAVAFNLSDILLALTFSAAIGIFFGFYPARRAAILNPIDALRYE